MLIEIDNNSEVPIYSQLVWQIKLGIIKGKLKPGDNLPSVRSLAGDIGINLHTVNKSYKELVIEGLVTQEKKGYKISEKKPAQISSDYLETVKAQLENIVIDAHIFNLDLPELLAELTKKLEEDTNND